MAASLVPRSFTSTSVVFVLLVAAASRAELSAASLWHEYVPVTASGNIRLAEVLVPVFDQLLQSSATFRRQVARITSAPYARIVVNAVPAVSAMSRGTARTTMRRFSEGALFAYVEIPTPLILSEYARLFGHEFEHVIEQLERVNLRDLATTGAAARLGDGAFETIRARDAGLAIAREAQFVAVPPAPPLSGVFHTAPAASTISTPHGTRQQ